MRRLFNQVMPYAWGSRSAIAALQGRPPSPTPEAELWLGTHVVAPSRVDGPTGATLAQVIAADPLGTLGPQVQARFGELPFLLKVLAAEAPLSLQAHPSKSQAEAGFARENAAQIPLTAPHRLYRDANHKPELICALSEFEALCGFRPVPESLALVAALQLDDLHAQLSQGLAQGFHWLMRLGPTEQRQLVSQTLAAVSRLPQPSASLVNRLAQQYPTDVGVVAALLLNHVTLQPGEALFLPAGNLHGYLRGTGIELMANSDNVLRGGLTPKHVDVEALMSVLRFEGAPVVIQHPDAPAQGEPLAQAHVPEFTLTRMALNDARVLQRRGPEILLCTAGEIQVSAAADRQTLRQGDSLFAAFNEGPLSLTGRGTVFRASVGL